MASWRRLFPDLGRRTLIMGVLNVTPDSFSDGVPDAGPDYFIDKALSMSEAGADILDVGGESTRPGSDAVSPAEEMSRVMPVIEGLRGKVPCPISIDTRRHETARAALSAGAQIVNDVTGFTDPAVRTLAAETGCSVVIVHMLGEPKTMQEDPQYDDAPSEIFSWLRARAEECERCGIARENICLDPGIGFGKTTEHNLQILARLSELCSLGYPVLVGCSRKRFIGEVTGAEVTDREPGTIAASLWSALQGASIIRVHNVPSTHQSLCLLSAITS